MLKRRALFALKIHLLYTTIEKCVHGQRQKSIYWLHTQTYSHSVEHNFGINLKRNSRLSFSVGWIKFAILLSETDKDNASCVYLTTTSLFLRLTIYTHIFTLSRPLLLCVISPSSLCGLLLCAFPLYSDEFTVKFLIVMEIKFYAEIIHWN